MRQKASEHFTETSVKVLSGNPLLTYWDWVLVILVYL